jgi:hypothetical protein
MFHQVRNFIPEVAAISGWHHSKYGWWRAELAQFFVGLSFCYLIAIFIFGSTLLLEGAVHQKVA